MRSGSRLDHGGLQSLEAGGGRHPVGGGDFESVVVLMGSDRSHPYSILPKIEYNSDLNARTAPLTYFWGTCLGKELKPLSEPPEGS